MKLLIAFIFIIVGTLANASTTLNIRSSFDTQNPYELVLTEPGKPDAEAPGIYGLIPGNKEPVLVVPGQVMGAGRTYSGILTQFPMAKVTRRYEMMAVVDGRITIFSHQSRAAVKESRFVVGQNAPAYDAITGAKVAIEPFTGEVSKDISVLVVGNTSGEGELFLISLKQPNIHGTGVTMAGVLKRGTNKMELLSQLTVVDYNFLTSNELTKLIPPGAIARPVDAFSVISRLHLQSISVPKKEDDGILRRYREAVKLYSSAMKKSEASQTSAKTEDLTKPARKPKTPGFSPPTFNLVERKLILKELPGEVILTDPITIFQQADPIHGQSKIYVGSDPRTSPGNPPADALGQVGHDPSNGRYEIKVLNAVAKKPNQTDPAKFYNNKPLLLMKIEGEPNLVYFSQVQGKYVVLKVSDLGIPKQTFDSESLAGIHENIRHPNGYYHYILLSHADKGKKGQTLFIRIEEAPGFARASTAVVLMNSFEPAERLHKRLRVQDEKNLGSGQLVLFDDVTPKYVTSSDKEKDAELQATYKQVPFRNLTMGRVGNDIPRVYLHPEKISTMRAYKLTHLRYRDIPGLETSTGLYVANSGYGMARPAPQPRVDSVFMEGHLLREYDYMPASERSKVDAESTPPIELRQRIDFVSHATKEVEVSFIPMLSAHQRTANLKQFDLAIVTHSLPATDESYVESSLITPAIARVNVPVPHTDFLSARFVVGRRGNRETLHLLVFVGKPGAGGSATDQGILIYPNITLSLDTRITRSDGTSNEIKTLQLKLSTNQPQWLYRGELNEGLVKSRIVFDTEGRPLWIETPDLERTDIKFAAKLLSETTKKVFVNQGTSGINIRYDEQLDDTTDLSLGGGSKWILMERKDVVNRVPGLSAHMTELAQQDEEAKKAGKKQRRKQEIIFPEFNSFFDQLAMPRTEPAKHRVMLVSKELYPVLRNMMMSRFLQKKDSEGAGPFNISNFDFSLYLFDPGFTPGEMQKELLKLGRKPSGRSELLFVDMESLLSTETATPPESRSTSLDDNSLYDEVEEPAPVKAAAAAAADDDSTGTDEEQEEVEKDADVAGTSDQTVPKEEAPKRSTASRKLRTEKEVAEDEAAKLKFPFSRLVNIANEGAVLGKGRLFPPPVVKRTPTLILATPQQWRDLQVSYPQERKAGVFDSFQVDSRFLTSSWTVWPPKSSRVSKEVTEFSRAPVSKDEYQVFESLELLMAKLSDRTTPAKHQLLVVPEEIKPLITRLMMTRWATDHKDLGHGWNYRNKDLALFHLELGAAKQEDVFDNFASMKGTTVSRRPVLLADMSDILKASRPTATVLNQTYRLRDPIAAGGAKESILGAVNNEAGTDNAESETDRSQIPHMIWWLAAEGNKIQPKRTKGWTIRSEVTPEIPTVIVTTEKELAALEQEASFESRFIDVKQSFEIVNLAKPSEERKIALLEELFRRPEVQALQYTFKHQLASSDEARRQLIGLIVGKVEQISRQQKLESTYAFLKIYTAIKKALTEDVELRKAREIDLPYIQRLFAKVLSLPLSWEILRPEDNLLKLRDPDAAARGLQEVGYEGATELKTRAVRGLTAHTRGGADRGRRIPSSVILIGDTSSGKTFLVEKMISYLGLKLYNYNKPLDEEAGAIVIRVMDLVDKEDPAHPEKLSVDKALEHLSNFLSMPNGWRGLVLFDDLHKAASKEILQKLMTFIQTMHEAENGIIRVRRMTADHTKTGEIREVPVRNLQMVITLNPTKDLKKRERYMEKYGRKDPVMEAVAALNRDGYEVEDSLLARFGEVIDMSEFPREAKVPSLLSTIREANQSEFSAYPRLMLVTPDTLDSLVNAFPSANARDFLSPATYALMNLSSDMPKAPIYLVEPQPVLLNSDGNPLPKGGWNVDIGADGLRKVEPGKIEQALRQRTAVYQVTPTDHFSKLQLISFMANNFRAQILNTVVIAAQADPSISGNHESRVTQLASLLMSIMGHFAQAPKMPLAMFDIRPQHMGIKDIDTIRELQKRIREHPSNAFMPLVNVPSQSRNGDVISLRSFLGELEEKPVERGRLDVLIDTSKEIQAVLETALAASVRVSRLSELQDPAKWVMSLTESDRKAEFKEAAQKLLNIYGKFSSQLYEQELLEMRGGKYNSMQFYDQYRLYWLAMDAAIMRLPWSYIANFVLNGVDLAVKDLALGQRAGFQNFVFKSQLSPLSTVTPESVLVNIRGMGPLRDVSGDHLKRYEQNFHGNCHTFLQIAAAGERK